MLFHKRSVLRALYYAQRSRLKGWLGWTERHRCPVLESGIQEAVSRHRQICRTLLAHLPPDLPPGFLAAEIGCGDCLAAADMMLGLGAGHVHLIENRPPTLTTLHLDSLKKTMAHDLPNRTEILSEAASGLFLNPAKATLHEGLGERMKLTKPLDLVYSYAVLEHVENLPSFFFSCRRMLKPGGWSLHMVDLTGHEFFEDPVPPLDFHTYPAWLYRLMFPRYRRAARNFADQFLLAMQSAGFEIVKVHALRRAEPTYLTRLRPHLRKEAQARSDEVLGLLEAVILARRLS